MRLRPRLVRFRGKGDLVDLLAILGFDEEQEAREGAYLHWEFSGDNVAITVNGARMT